MNDITPLVEQITGQYPKAAQRLLRGQSMAEYSTFKTGGTADLIFSPNSSEELIVAIQTARRLSVPVTVLGNGSNVLVSDKGIRGLTVIVGKEFSTIERVGNTQIVSQAGAMLATVAKVAASAGLAGMEFAGGIPGTIGGAIYMNAGAYDGCMADIVVRTQGYHVNEDREFFLEGSVDHQFAYRKSAYGTDGSIVLKIWLELREGNKHEIVRKMEELLTRRRISQPLELPSAGSTFKRPVGHFAGKLIEDAGLKGYRIGGACVCEKHAGFIVNDQHATAQEIRDLILYVQKQVFDMHGIHIEPEVRFVGEW